MIPANTFDAIEQDDELVRAIMQLGQAFDLNVGLAESFIELMDLGHRKSVEWSMSELKDIDSRQAAEVYLHLLDRIDSDRREKPGHTALAIRAVAALVDINPQLVLERLAQSKDDGIQQQAILLGLFETRLPIAGQAAASIKRIGLGRADSIALILLAKHAPALSPEDKVRLGTIASGGARITGSLQTQAAWLYLRHAGVLSNALTLLLDGSS